MGRAAEGVARRPVSVRLVAGDRAHGAAGGAHQRRKVPQALALGEQRLLLRLARLRAVDLLQLPLEQVQLAVARAGPRAQLLELLAQRSLARVGGREPLAPRGLLRPAEAVQDLELRGGEREPAVLVLAVEGQQLAADLRQVGRRGAAAAEIGPRAALGAHAPGEDQLVGALGQALGERLAQRDRQREDPLDVRLRGARPHDPGPWLAAQQQVERVREHRLARPGLAGQDVQARAEAELGPFDQQEVLDAQFVEHGAGSISASRRSRPRSRGL